MNSICITCKHYCQSCGMCRIYRTNVRGMNLAPCRQFKPIEQPEQNKDEVNE